MSYALCPMPYALCPMPYAHEYLIFLRKAIFNPTIILATNQATAFSQNGFTNSPIKRWFEVNITKGITAKGNCKLRIT